MSKFVDRLQSLSRSSATPIGFRSFVSELKSPPMLLVAEMSGTQIKEARIAADFNADAGLVLSEDTGAHVLRQIVESMGSVPLGVLVKGMDEKEVDELAGFGCDFVVFDIKGAAGILSRKEVGRFLMIEPSLDQGLVRAINNLDVDGVFVSKGGSSFVAVEHLLVCRRLVELLEKPIIMTLPSLSKKEELTSLWQVGVDGVVAPRGWSPEGLAELKEMIGSLPRGRRGRRGRASVQLPHYDGGAVGEEDEQEEKLQP